MINRINVSSNVLSSLATLSVLLRLTIN